jgi:ribosomal protein S4
VKDLTATADVVSVRLLLCHGHVNAAKIAENSIVCKVEDVVSIKVVMRLADNKRYMNKARRSNPSGQGRSSSVI